MKNKGRRSTSTFRYSSSKPSGLRGNELPDLSLSSQPRRNNPTKALIPMVTAASRNPIARALNRGLVGLHKSAKPIHNTSDTKRIKSKSDPVIIFRSLRPLRAYDVLRHRVRFAILQYYKSDTFLLVVKTSVYNFHFLLA